MNALARSGKHRRMVAAVAVCAAIVGIGTPVVSGAGPSSFDVPATAFSSNTGYFPFVVAQQKAFYERYGVKPNFINSSGGGVALRAFTSSDAPIGIEGLPSALPAIENGGEFRIIGQMSRSSDTWLVTRADSDIRTVADLRGKTIGVTSPGSTLESVALGALTKAGMSSRDARIVYLGSIPNEIVALDNKVVDAIAAAGQVQLFHHTKTLKNWRLLGRGSDFVPVIDAVIVAKLKTIRENPNLILNFMRGVIDGRNYIIGNRNNSDLTSVVEKWQSITDSALSPAVRSMIADLGRTNNAENFFGDLTVDMTAVRGVAKSLVDGGRMKAMPTNWSLFVNQQFALRVTKRVVASITDKGSSIRQPLEAKLVKSLKAGTYTIVVHDTSRKCGFRLVGPRVLRKTTALYRGTQNWVVKLYKGAYTYGCTTGKAATGTLRVS